MVRLPWAFTRNVPLPVASLELDALLGASEDELGRLLDGTSEDELERLLDGTSEDELERELLDTTDELELEGGNDDELGRLLDVTTLEDVPQLVKPNGDGWLVQVAREIQLLLFS